MKLTKSEIIKIITAIRVQCPEALNYKNDSELDLVVSMWFDCFKDYSKELVWQATRQALMNGEYQKLNWLGVINKEVEKILSTLTKTNFELWNQLTLILQEVAKLETYTNERVWHYNRWIIVENEIENLYDSLDEILKGYVGGVTELKELSRLETLEYEKGRFLKLIEGIREREKIKKQLPIAVLDILKVQKFDLRQISNGEK